METVKQVVQVLSEMVTAHKEAAAVIKEKQNVLIKGDIAGLQQLLQQESQLSSRIEELEGQRSEYVKQHMSMHGMVQEGTTLDELAATAAPSDKQLLQSLAKELRSLVDDIISLNEKNRQLIEASLSYVHYSIGLLVPKEQPIGYGAGNGRYASVLDAKI